mmetsp:Transcript_134025/g.267448  ORF Transcript_134025/g.267448 Transcript_134025/m.267448 type:complete len:680 (-) Transcript_134025:118-2157(-)
MCKDQQKPMLLDISDYEGTTYPSIHERIEGLITEGAVRLEDDVAVLRKCRKDGRHSTSLVGPDWLKDNEPPLPMDNQRSDRSLDNSSSEHKFGIRLSAVEAMMTSCCGRIETQLRMLEEAKVISRISGLENLVHNHHGEVITEVRTLSEAIGLGRMVHVEHEAQLGNIQLASIEVERCSSSHVLAEIAMQLGVLLRATRDAECRAADREEFLLVRMETASQSIEALSRRVDDCLRDATDGNEIVASRLKETDVRLLQMEAKVDTLASQQREACCECEALQGRFATMKVQVDRLEGEMSIGLLARLSDHIESLDSIVNRVESETSMRRLVTLSDRIEKVADKVDQLEGDKVDQLEGQISRELFDKLSDDQVKLMEVKSGNCMSLETRDVATEVVGYSKSSDRPEAELWTALTCLSERLTKLDLDIGSIRDTVADETSLCSKLPKVSQLSQRLLRLDSSVSTLQRGLGETHRLCGKVHEIAKDNKKGFLVLSERVSQPDNAVGNVLAPPVSWQSELQKQIEIELENTRTSCREACKAAESLGTTLRSDMDILVKTSAGHRQDTTHLNDQAEKLKAEIEKVASRVDLLVSAEAKSMQQGLQTLDKICDAFQREQVCEKIREKRQLLAGERAGANTLASKVASGGSGGSVALKPSGSGTCHGSRPTRQLLEVKVETRSKTLSD